MQKLLFKNSAIYSISSFLQKGIMFLLLPFYTQYLSPAEYGTISVVLASSFFWTVFFTLGLDGAIVRFYYNDKYKDDFKNFAGTLIVSIFAFSVISYVILVTAGQGILRLFYSDIPLYPYAYIGLLILIFQPVYNFTLSFLQAKNQALNFSVLSFAYFFFNVLFTVLTVIIFKLGAIGYILSVLCAYSVSCVVGLITLRGEFSFNFKGRYFKDAIQYSYPFIPHSFLAQASGDMDKFVLNKYIETAVVGVYQLAYSVSFAIDILAHSAGRAFSPLFIQNLNEGTDEAKNLVLKSTLSTIFAFLVFGIGCSFFIPDFIRLFFKEEYHISTMIIPILVFGFLNSGLYYLFSNPLFFDASLTKFIPVCTLFSGLATIGLDFLLIPSLGMVGAASAVFIGRFILVITSSFFAAKSNLIKWPYLKTFYAYLVSISFALFVWFGDQSFSGLMWVAIKMVLFVIHIAVISSILLGNAFAFIELSRVLNRMKNMI